MTDNTVFFYPSITKLGNADSNAEKISRLPKDDVHIESATCTEAESFVLRVLDDSMEPEFRRGCIIVIDPTGRATDGSFVLARQASSSVDDPAGAEQEDKAVDGYVFRQLRHDAQDGWSLRPLNEKYHTATEAVSMDAIVGVIVQRAGTRRRYHKRYD